MLIGSLYVLLFRVIFCSISLICWITNIQIEMYWVKISCPVGENQPFLVCIFPLVWLINNINIICVCTSYHNLCCSTLNIIIDVFRYWKLIVSSAMMDINLDVTCILYVLRKSCMGFWSSIWTKLRVEKIGISYIFYSSMWDVRLLRVCMCLLVEQRC